MTNTMTVPLIIDTILLLGIFVGALFTWRHLLGAGASFLLVSFEIFTTKQGGAETYFQGLAVLLITILIVSDGKKKEKGLLLYRFSPYNNKSKGLALGFLIENAKIHACGSVGYFIASWLLYDLYYVSSFMAAIISLCKM